MDAGATLSHDDYTVGWICALPLEMAAAKLMMDIIHPSLPSPPTDQNTYILGNIGEHNIIIACLPGGAYGNVSAATVAMQLLSSFHSIRFGLMVGIGGGIPSSNVDIRLGNIVNKKWQGYAAAAAAAYAKELLLVVPINQVDDTPTAQDTLANLITVLHGLGGIGKTHSILPRIPGKPQDHGAIDNEELEQQARELLQWLAKDGNSRWLIIFDNIDQYSPTGSGIRDVYDIGKFFPTADQGSILVTSQLAGLTELGKSVPVHKLNSTEAIQLLLENSGLLGNDNIRQLDANLDTLALAKRLDGLLLAIVIAAAFMLAIKP
ncbi:uncharacterized protein N7483_007481 [Penicillium malachiteum]|uniref:uncharacterized protein n=1 Tax=Penicillium malachiteum TaxID=1324776 RepID=UPI0025489351|nr:uncharacterized protein N7483_007481 [Penicillium malachiteum]KAJ5726124.1 hypothetical protein N7483_007481 [Penicillium malachiteum]